MKSSKIISMKNVRGSSTFQYFHDRHKCSSSNDEGRTCKMATQNTYTQFSGNSPGGDNANAAITIKYSAPSSKRLTPSLLLQQYFTKGYYFTEPPFKLLGQISKFSVAKLSLSRLFALIALFL